jgi:hypothetical protein
MKSTPDDPKNLIVPPVAVYHLVTRRSALKPLCGLDSPDAKIGSFWERLDERFEHWIRDVLDENGEIARGCDDCLRRHPSLSWEPHELYNYLNLQAVITISPYPRSMKDEFIVKGHCIGDEFAIEPTPTVTGQYPKDGKVALTLVTHIIPKSAKRR